MISLNAPLQLWTGDKGSWHFMVLPEALAGEVRLHALMNPKGFGSVRVECSVGEIVWRTSLFPQKSGGYFLPVKAQVCQDACLSAGEEVAVELRLL